MPLQRKRGRNPLPSGRGDVNVILMKSKLKNSNIGIHRSSTGYCTSILAWSTTHKKKSSPLWTDPQKLDINPISKNPSWHGFLYHLGYTFITSALDSVGRHLASTCSKLFTKQTKSSNINLFFCNATESPMVSSNLMMILWNKSWRLWVPRYLTILPIRPLGVFTLIQSESLPCRGDQSIRL